MGFLLGRAQSGADESFPPAPFLVENTVVGRRSAVLAPLAGGTFKPAGFPIVFFLLAADVRRVAQIPERACVGLRPDRATCGNSP